MNNYDLLINELSIKLKETTEKEAEMDKKAIINQEELASLIKKRDEINTTIKNLEKIKEILLANNFKKELHEFIYNIPKFLIVLGIINIIIIGFLGPTSPFLIILLNSLIIFLSTIEEYVPNISTLRILIKNNLPKTEEKLAKISQELKKINKNIIEKESTAKKYTEASYKALRIQEELAKNLNLVINKKNEAIKNILDQDFEDKINRAYKEDKELKLIRVK